MSQKLNTAITVVGIDIGKNSFHVVSPVPGATSGRRVTKKLDLVQRDDPAVRLAVLDPAPPGRVSR